MEPTHIVVDTRDGYDYRAASDGVLFGAETARAFAEQRNAELKPEFRTYVVRRLVPDETPREQLARAYAERRAEVGPDWAAFDRWLDSGELPHVCGSTANTSGRRCPECGAI